MTNVLPTSIIVQRREPRAPRNFGDLTRYVRGRLPLRIAPKPSPPPIPRQSQFWDKGRTYDHAYPHAWVTVDLSGMAATRAIRAPFFKFPRVPGAMVIRAGSANGHNPIVARVNIASPGNMAYSDLLTAAPGIPYNSAYAKLL